jgi:hypothetical protein
VVSMPRMIIGVLYASVIPGPSGSEEPGIHNHD